MIHVAILKPGYLRDVLAGRKTMESRFTKTRRAPFGKVRPGDLLYLKASAGPYMATAIAGEVLSFEGLTPQEMDRLRDQYDEQIRGEDDYWRAKRDSRYATLIELIEVEPADEGPKYKAANMQAWYVLDGAELT